MLSDFSESFFHSGQRLIDFHETLLEADDTAHIFEVLLAFCVGDHVDLANGQRNDDGVEDNFVKAADALLDGDLTLDGLGGGVRSILKQCFVQVVLAQMPIVPEPDEEVVQVGPLVFEVHPLYVVDEGLGQQPHKQSYYFLKHVPEFPRKLTSGLVELGLLGIIS